MRALVKDICDLRLAKLRKSIDQMVTQQETYGKVRLEMFNGGKCTLHVIIWLV